MAEEYGIVKSLHGLAGSCMTARNAPASTSESRPRLEMLRLVRSELRAGIARAWSREAIVRGAGHARAGNYVTALKCYEQALEMDPSNADAYVALGAAMANAGELERAGRQFHRLSMLDKLRDIPN